MQTKTSPTILTEEHAVGTHLVQRVLVVDTGGAGGHALTVWLRSIGAVADHSELVHASSAASHLGATFALLDATVIDEDVLTRCSVGLRRARPEICIALLLDQADVHRGEEIATSVGADGALSADIAPSRLIRVLSSTTPRSLLPRQSSRRALPRQEIDAGQEELARLTKREREVLAFITAGTATESISQQLGISLNTVRTHVQNILGKLDCRSRLELAAVGRRAGMPSELKMAV